MSDQPDLPPERPPQAPTRDYRPVAIGLAVALLLVVALVGTAPLWAPHLPWTAPPPQDAALDARLARIDMRLAALEGKPAPPPPPDLSELRREIGKLAARVDGIDQAVRAQPAGDATDMALALALLQIRDAVELGRPFGPAYDALAALTRERSDLAAAAAPLAGPAKSGLATRAVLANRLHELAGTIAAAQPPAEAAGERADWTDAALARLRGLVTIRRVDDATPRQPAGSAAATVNSAELALAGGDLDGAVAALDKLQGAAAEAAQSWLRMAKDRLAVEGALQKIEAQLAGRFGATAR